MSKWSNPYQINYNDVKIVDELKKLGQVTFKSKVLNMLILYTNRSKLELSALSNISAVVAIDSSLHKR